LIRVDDDRITLASEDHQRIYLEWLVFHAIGLDDNECVIINGDIEICQAGNIDKMESG
jgi:hypothetical protein